MWSLWLSSCWLVRNQFSMLINVRKESALHIAVKNNRVDAVKVMLEWLKLLDSEFVLGWTDEESNTTLHIAASRNYIEVS